MNQLQCILSTGYIYFAGDLLLFLAERRRRRLERVVDAETDTKEATQKNENFEWKFCRSWVWRGQENGKNDTKQSSGWENPFNWGYEFLFRFLVAKVAN